MPSRSLPHLTKVCIWCQVCCTPHGLWPHVLECVYVCVPIANCPASGLIQSMLCLCLWQFSGVLCTHLHSKKGMVRGSRLYTVPQLTACQ